jgi:hypothetical protein
MLKSCRSTAPSQFKSYRLVADVAHCGGIISPVIIDMIGGIMIGIMLSPVCGGGLIGPPPPGSDGGGVVDGGGEVDSTGKYRKPDFTVFPELSDCPMAGCENELHN